MSTPTDAELDRLYACYRQLWLHVNADHGLDAHGPAGAIERIHQHAHHAERTAWHDAWTIPDTDGQDRR
jgi:hypothetical protein